MTREELEFQISQFLDGVLPGEEAAVLHDLIQRDPQAAALLEEHRKLDTMLRGALPMPQVTQQQWDALTNQISAAVSEAQVAQAVDEPAPLRIPAPQPIVEGMRVGDIDLTQLKAAARPHRLAMPWVGNLARLAIAASVLLVVAAGIRYWTTSENKPLVLQPEAVRPEAQVHIEIAEVNVEPPAGPVVNEIAIGPSSNLSQARAASLFADSVVDQGQRVVIASQLQPAHDSALPY